MFSNEPVCTSSKATLLFVVNRPPTVPHFQYHWPSLPDLHQFWPGLQCVFLWLTGAEEQIFYGPYALSVTQPTVSKHSRELADTEDSMVYLTTVCCV